jgi:hypothetical protein
MADLNALIAQGAQFRQPESPLNMMAQLQQLQQNQSANQLNQMNIAEKQRLQEEQIALRGLYSRSVGKMESPEFLQQLASQSPTAYQAQLKFLSEQAESKAKLGLTTAQTGEATAKTKEAQLSTKAKQKEFVNRSLSDLSRNPSDSNIIAFGEDAVLDGHLTAEQAKAKTQQLLAMSTPERQQYLSTQGLSNKDTAELFQSKPEEKTDGQTKWMQEGNPRLPNYGKRMIGPTDIKMQATPGEQLTADTAAAGQESTVKTARARLAFEQTKFNWEKANPGFDLIQDAEGAYLAVNKKNKNDITPLMMAAPGGGAAPPVAGAAPAVPGARGAINVGDGGRPAMVPVTGKAAALTESQGASTTYGMRMKEAHDILTNLEKQGETNTGRIRGVVSGTVGLVPLIGDKLEGVTGSIYNALPQIMGGLSPEQQQVQQARINFITAQLRKESGASISVPEFATAERLYFPQPGDDAKTIAQKQKTRETSIRGMKVQAGPGAKNIGAAGSTSDDPLGLRTP